MIDFLLCINMDDPGNIRQEFIQKPPCKITISNELIDFYAWGDPIADSDFEEKLMYAPDVKTIVGALKGHFYYLLQCKKQNTVFAGNSLFGILPLYYQQTHKKVFLSNSPFKVSEQTNSRNYNNRFLLENLLFRYPLFNHSCIKDISLLPCNHYIEVYSENFFIKQHTEIEQYFTKHPASWKKSVHDLSDLFIDCSKKYFPDQPYVSAMTGGFDGRTLVSCGLFFKRAFSTYSFGTSSSDDVLIAAKLSEKAGIPYNNIILDEKYVLDHSLSCGVEFINGSAGNASFSRAHYLYAVKLLSEKTKYMITGNFGSEIFRAAHIAGVMISPNLYALFNADSFSEAIETIENAPEWRFLRRNELAQEWEGLMEDLKTLPCFSAHYKGLTKNQQFYKIVFEEVFRKYFGAEMVNQFQYLANRTPFLDFDFVKSILSTGLAGVNSDFFTHNPFKRYKGQILYAHIIQKTYPGLGNEKTDKGYAPSDLLSVTGKAMIIKSFLNKRTPSKARGSSDPYSVNAAFDSNKEFLKKGIVDIPGFDHEFINNAIKTRQNRDALFIALSQALFYNMNFK